MRARRPEPSSPIASHVFAFVRHKRALNRRDNVEDKVLRMLDSYGMMASHYGVGVLPARPRRPKDKSKVENGVRFAQSCVLGRLRNQTFFSLAEANAAIGQALDRINDHVMRRLGVSCRQLFESVERAALASLPGEEYEFAEWRLVRVSTDYHVEFKTFLYSVPHNLIRQQVDLRATARTIEIFHRGKRVAVHQRRYGGPRHGTDPDHIPSSHRRYAEWTPDRFRRWAADRRVGHRNPFQPSASRIGLSNMSGCPAPVSRHRTQSGRSCISTRCRDRWPGLQKHCFASGQP